VALACLVALSSALGAGLVTSVVSAPPASAHAELVKISPSANAQLTTAPARVLGEFNEPVSTSFATVVVTSGGGVSVARGTPTVSGSTITQALKFDLPSGSYRIAYRVTSDDGHPVTGESRFTVNLVSTAGPATSAPSTSEGGSTPGLLDTAASSGGSKAGPVGSPSRFAVLISGSVALLVIGVGLLFRERRRP